MLNSAFKYLKSINTQLNKEDTMNNTKTTKIALFTEMLKNGPVNMKQVKEASWNDRNATFYDAFNALRRKGLASRDKSGMFYVNSYELQCIVKNDAMTENRI